jgi:hypothetical protein
MARWAHSDVLDNGPVYIRSNTTHMVLVGTYSAGDNYTAVFTTNKLAQQAMTTTDSSLAGAANNPRVLTVTTSGKSSTATATITTGIDLHIAFVDTAASKVLWVTDETSNQAIYSGNTVNWPTTNITYTSNQPT